MRHELRGTKQAGFVRIMADRLQPKLAAIRLEQDGCAADRQFADAAATKSAADNDHLGLTPCLQPKESTTDGRKFLGEFLDCAQYKAGRVGIALQEQLVELASLHVFAGLL